MKKYLIYSLLLLTGAFIMASCSDDELSKESIIMVDQVNENDFDRWLKANFIDTYNIEVKYRFEDIETDHNYYVIPADYNQAIKLAHIVKYACLEAFDEACGVEFTRANYPKLIYMTGNWRYKNNGSFILGTAEGGRKIYLDGVNHVDQYTRSRANLNHYYVKTLFHEFTHILNQTKEYSTAYKLITPNTYVADDCFKAPNDTGYYHRGYISAYAQKNAGEDFAEMFSIYVTNDAETWQKYMTDADTNGFSGSQFLKEKLEMVKSYMRDSWGLDMDVLRSIVLRRETDIVNRSVDLTDLTVN